MSINLLVCIFDASNFDVNTYKGGHLYDQLSRNQGFIQRNIALSCSCSRKSLLNSDPQHIT